MSDINRVVLTGRFTRDSELRYTNNGAAVLNGSLATNKSIKKNGEWTETGMFFDIKMFGKRAESLSRYLLKGTAVTIEGSLDWQSWEKDGVKRSKVDIVVDNVKFMGGKDGKPKANSNYQPPGANEKFTDDIPF